tara:strand:- start:1248 stop:2408 length:1161 start_codon:yes stop_codon:yes gene_type:complete
MDWIFDDRTDCWSVLTTLSVRDYLNLVERAHQDRGGLPGQRDTLTTTTAKRIRERMVDDIRRGAVLPPVVIGATVSTALFDRFPIEDGRGVHEFLPDDVVHAVSIIDGMQRTAALTEAAEADVSVLDHVVRVEFWLTRNVQTMIYRMLVLNTGQVPWTLSRQLSVVFAPLIQEIRNNVAGLDRIFTPDRPGRRLGPGQFGSDALVELYIAFSLRKTTVDAKEALSEEFSRLDFVENLSEERFQHQFYSTVSILAALDRVFSAYEPGGAGRLTKGRNIFDGQPARIGLVVAIGQHILGRPGLDRDAADRERRMADVIRSSSRLVARLEGLTAPQVGEFLQLDVLRETLDRRVGQVGRYERGVFFDAFKVLIEEDFNLPTMEACWRAN